MRERNGTRLICFDLGGVIVRLRRSWAEACEAVGLDVRLDLDDPHARVARAEIRDLYATGRIDCQEWASRMCECIGGRYEPDEIRRIHNAWIMDEYPGLEELVDRIHAAGHETACLSNTNAGHWALLTAEFSEEHGHRYPTIARLRRRHASHLLGYIKPDPAIYRAFERASGFRGDSILFFDDLVENVQAAIEAGWDAVRVDPSESTAPQIEAALVERRLLGLS